MTNPVIAEERAGAINGVPGRFFGRTIGGRNYKPDTFTSQRWISERRPIDGYGNRAEIQTEIRFDDQCRNGHNTFAITADVCRPGRRDIVAGGCMHDDIRECFPEIAPLIRWHLMSADGPSHYVANTVYHASNRDYNGALAGEAYRWQTTVQFGDNPIKHRFPGKFIAFLQSADSYDFDVVRLSKVESSALGRPTTYQRWTFAGFGSDWHDGPFETEGDAQDFLAALRTCKPAFVKVPCAWGEGKERNLDAARRIAIWPDATDAQLCADKAELTAALEARLPGLIAEFRADIEAAGFAWAPETTNE